MVIQSGVSSKLKKHLLVSFHSLGYALKIMSLTISLTEIVLLMSIVKFPWQLRTAVEYFNAS